MSFVKNYPQLGSSLSRKVVLNVIEAGIAAVQTNNVLQNNFKLEGEFLHIQGKVYNLTNYDRVFLIGFGKGSAEISKFIETILASRLSTGFVIDLVEESFEKCEFTLGTHPLPSRENLEFTKKVVDKMTGLTDRDLVIVVICGGGSVMFEMPFNIDMSKLIEVNQALLESGLGIQEMNTIRKHLSKTKGGGLAQLLHPASIASLIFSDVPGNDLSTIASGPTTKDHTTKSEALEIYNKNLTALNLSEDNFLETPKEDNVFSHVTNILMLSNTTALNAMKTEAEKWGIKTQIYSETFQGDAEIAGKTLINNTPENTLLLVGGETTVTVKNSDGKGGRNQHMVLSVLKEMDQRTTIAAFDSDGWDNTPAAGAIGDSETLEKAKKLNLNIQEYLDGNDSFLFFNSVEDAIITDRLPSNVADLILVYKH